jgi:hypothetical protein
MTRDRGTYGPSDRDRHFVAGWVGDQTLDYVRDETIGAALRPALPAIDDVFKGTRGAQRMWAAAKGIGGRDEAAKPATIVGQELFHTVADRERAMLQVSTGFKALSNDLALWIARNKGDPEADVSGVVHWIAADVTPTFAEFGEFVARENKSWWTRMATSWETFEQWWSRLKQLRALARAHGVTLQSTEPTSLPKTIWQNADEGNGSEATAILGVLKIGALTALGIMGAAGLYSAIRGLREKAEGAADESALRRIIREELRSTETK